jgi:hypothetical protein
MANEVVQVQMTREELQEFFRGVFAAAAGTLQTCRPIDQLVTVDGRCKQRWPAATKKNQRRIRDVCLGIYRERLGRHPYKLTGYLNGTFAVEREHLDLLDLAIDVVKGEVESRESLSLFARRRR